VSRSPLVLSVNAAAVEGRDGIAGDVAVFDELGCAAACVATAVLSASAEVFTACDAVSDATIARQLAAAGADARPAAAKLGMIASAAQAVALAPKLAACVPDSLIYAPVIRVAEADVLGRAEIKKAWSVLAPLARAVIVRAVDLDAILGHGVTELDEVSAAAAELRARGARAAVVAGFLSRERVVDVVDDGGAVAVFDTGRLRVPHVAGLSGAFAAAVTAHLALGLELRRAVQAAQRYVALRLHRGR
jgi:hydroxymethylpyrimidine/phosphomethylpyrimidine kinase